jgi:hypothetical protein
MVFFLHTSSFKWEIRGHLAYMDDSISIKSDQAIMKIKPPTIQADLQFYNSTKNIFYGKKDPIAKNLNNTDLSG